MPLYQSEALISCPADKLFGFLADARNHEQLMPSSISNWTASENEASFTVQGMINLRVRIDERKKPSQIILNGVDAPFSLQMKWVLSEESPNYTQVSLSIDAALNAMMSMMAGGKLQELAHHQTQQLKETFS